MLKDCGVRGKGKEGRSEESGGKREVGKGETRELCAAREAMGEVRGGGGAR
jgi:hypothetical protein